MKRRFMAALLLAASACAYAQHHGYAGHESRDIKSLSDEEIRQYQAGAGMGYAKAAELNHFPGPMHVLELADKLNLTPAQREQTSKLMQTHKEEARALGARLVEAERAIEQIFRKGSPDQRGLAEAVHRAAAVEGEYRLSHLETHRRMRALLTEAQVKQYDVLRGYGTGRPQQHKH